jgi:hypothetical protein
MNRRVIDQWNELLQIASSISFTDEADHVILAI